ncbi:MAG: hypothetical protein HY543_12410 [Deltaproteobacteria bacterium]|nr:hypothetical protein [Deltaproteobacteria bacterium]
MAQEIWRRAILQRVPHPESVGFWQSEHHEIDCVAPDDALIEVKRGAAGPFDFQWFPQGFPNRRLIVICRTPFETDHVQGMTMEDFLLGK